MKTKKLLTMSLAAIMAFALTACGEKPFDYGTVEAEKIVMSRNAVTEISIGETIDLAENVKVTPEDVKWNVVEVESYEGIVKIDGTKITGVKAGHFKVRIVAGPSLASKVYEGDVISQAIKDARSLFAAMDEFNYTASLLSNETAKKYEDRLYTIACHNENYFSFINEDGEFEGMMKSGKGHSLQYTYGGASLDLDQTTHLPYGGTLEVEAGYYADLSLYTFTTPMAIRDDLISESDDVDGIVLDVDATLLETIFATTLGVDYEALKAEVGTIKSCTIEYNPSKEAAAHLYFSDKNNKDLCELLIENVGSTSIKEVEDYIKSKEEPALPVFQAFNDAMNDINSKKNYKMTGKISIGSYNKAGAWVETTNATAIATMAEDWQGITPASYTVYVDGENYIAYDDSTGNATVYGYDNGLYYNTGVNNNGVYTWEEKQAIEGFDSIWSEGLAISDQGYTSAAAITPVDISGEELESICWATITEKDGVTVGESSVYGDYGYFCQIAMSMVPDYGSGIAFMFSTLYSTAYPTAQWYDFMDGVDAFVDTNNNTVTIATSLSGMIQVGNAVYGVRLETTFSDVGTSQNLDSIIAAALA
ncbi:MAG: hypothetical protein MJ238_00280 [Bacilli bacterium]|nr:hypothetical protein [Bacilli bacterium]